MLTLTLDGISKYDSRQILLIAKREIFLAGVSLVRKMFNDKGVVCEECLQLADELGKNSLCLRFLTEVTEW